MPQTMLALLALVLTSLIAHNQQRLQQRAYQGMIRDELEVSATGTAQNVIELIGARAFDESSVPQTLSAVGAIDVPRTASLFALESTFGVTDRGTAGCHLTEPSATPECDDLDDVHGVSGTVDVDMGGGRSLPFEAEVEIDYVTGPDEDAPEATVPTLHKRVTLVMSSPLILDGQRPIVIISRVFSYDPVKAEFDYERLYGPFGTTG